MSGWLKRTLDRRQTELLGNLGVLDPVRIIETHAPDELGQVAAGGDGRAASKSLEFDVGNLVGLGVDSDLQLHDIAARRSADESRPNIQILLVHGADIARLRVVVQDLLVVGSSGVDGSDRRKLASRRKGGWSGERCAQRTSGGDAESSGEHSDEVCDGVDGGGRDGKCGRRMPGRRRATNTEGERGRRW